MAALIASSALMGLSLTRARRLHLARGQAPLLVGGDPAEYAGGKHPALVEEVSYELGALGVTIFGGILAAFCTRGFAPLAGLSDPDLARSD